MSRIMFKRALTAIILIHIVAIGAVEAEPLPSAAPLLHKLNKFQPKISSSFVVMDFEDDVLHDEEWLLTQPKGFVGSFVASKGDSGADKLTLGVGEGRRGGNALVVESTDESMGLPGFWLLRMINKGGWLGRPGDEAGYILPQDRKANRISFWLKFERGFMMNRAAAQPPEYPNHQNLHFGTYQFDPNKIKGSNGVVESDNWHFYHMVHLRHDKADGDWIHVVLNQNPQHQRSRSALPPNNPTAAAGNYWELLTRLYIDNFGYFDDPEKPYPVRMWVDDIELLYVEEAMEMQVEFQGKPGTGVVEIDKGIEQAFTVVFSNEGENNACGMISIATPYWLSPVLTDVESRIVKKENYCLSPGQSEILTLTLKPNTDLSVGYTDYVGVSFAGFDQIQSDNESISVSLSSPYVERRWYPEIGAHDAVLSGDHVRVRIK